MSERECDLNFKVKHEDNREIDHLEIERILFESDYSYLHDLRSAIVYSPFLNEEQKDEVRTNLNLEAKDKLGESLDFIDGCYFPDQFEVKDKEYKETESFPLVGAKSLLALGDDWMLTVRKKGQEEKLNLIQKIRFKLPSGDEIKWSSTYETNAHVQINLGQTLPNNKAFIASPDGMIKSFQIDPTGIALDEESQKFTDTKEKIILAMHHLGDEIITLTLDGTINRYLLNAGEIKSREEIDNIGVVGFGNKMIQRLPDGSILASHSNIIYKYIPKDGKWKHRDEDNLEDRNGQDIKSFCTLRNGEIFAYTQNRLVEFYEDQNEHRKKFKLIFELPDRTAMITSMHAPDENHILITYLKDMTDARECILFTRNGDGWDNRKICDGASSARFSKDGKIFALMCDDNKPEDGKVVIFDGEEING